MPVKMGLRYLGCLLYSAVVQGEKLFDNAFKIWIVNVQKVIDVPRSRIKNLKNTGFH